MITIATRHMASQEEMLLLVELHSDVGKVFAFSVIFSSYQSVLFLFIHMAQMHVLYNGRAFGF